MNNILVIGAVKTTELTLKALVKNGFNVVGVLGHEPKNVDNVSGWVDLKQSALSLEIDYKGFSLINNEDNLEWARTKKPDIIFAVGFSQLMSNEWLEMPSLGCIGFHPTKLPKGRGRAPIAWLTLEEKIGAATFFLMGEGADDGPIFVQEDFYIEDNDNATDVENKIGESINKALDKWLPKLLAGEWNPLQQNEIEATWYGKRAQEDGLINWNLSSFEIDRLIKASSYPHPGAFSFFKDNKVIIWKSSIENDIPIKGVVGRVLLIKDSSKYLIQCGEGLIWIDGLIINENLKLKIGDKLGYNVENELYILKNLLIEKGIL